MSWPVGRHDCCCGHVVDVVLATPGPRLEVIELARRKLQDCPHTEAGNLLEMLVAELRSAEEVE